MANIRPTGLKAYKGQNRVLLVFAPSQSAECVEQRRLFDEANAGLTDRDLRVFYLVGDEANGNATGLRERFSVSEGVFTLVLIGKDGGEKERFSEPVQPEELFGIIDQMPIRQREMREGA